MAQLSAKNLLLPIPDFTGNRAIPVNRRRDSSAQFGTHFSSAFGFISKLLYAQCSMVPRRPDQFFHW